MRCPFVERTHPPDKLLYVEGQRADHVWLVKRGTVALYRETGESRGEGRVDALRFPGQLIALEGLVTGCYNHSARTVTRVSLCGATRDGVDAWLGPKGTPARTALELTLRASSAAVTKRAAPDGRAVERVAGWLLDEGPRGITLTAPRRHVAALLGMRPETLSRALSRLSRTGAIEVQRGSLKILDEDKLAEVAHGRGN